jgi:hypothetical protein
VDGGPGHGGAVVLGEVPAEGVGAGVVTVLEELLVQAQNQLDGLGWGRTGRGLGAPGPGLERGLASAR